MSHWADHRERGSFWLMRFTVAATRLLGRRLLAPLLYAIVLYFFATGRTARRSAHQYQAHLAAWSHQAALRPTSGSVFRQFMAFAESLLDKLDVWHGRIGLQHLEVDDPAGLRPQTHSGVGRGQMLVGAHLGNLEVCRALAEMGKKARMNVLVHTKHAESFNRLLGEAGANHLRLIQVSELDPGVMLQLSECLERGEWLAIAGDRVPLHGARCSEVEFLGQPALLPQGPWLLAGLLQCPVNLLFCLKHNGRYRISLEHFANRIEWRRQDRDQVLAHAAQRYADRLAARCLEAPLQWFNFYPFWKRHE
jgi:predicted LPLAT superfamily acyltransferase